jgi:hypothetical protein
MNTHVDEHLLDDRLTGTVLQMTSAKSPEQ